MKRSISTIIIFVALFTFGNAYSQDTLRIKRCGTNEYMARKMAEDPTLKSRMEQDELMLQRLSEMNPNGRRADVNTVVTIPVIFHILYNNANQNISAARINDQINTLNKDYARLNADSNNTPAVWRPLAANTNIQFCAAQRDPSGNPLAEPGITRVSVSVAGFDPILSDSVKYTTKGGDDAWSRNQYLNVWVCNFIGNSVDLLGISQFPNMAAATDGCCVLYSTVGGATTHGTLHNYNLGRTLTHEAGHWFGLHHVWGDDDDNLSGLCHSATECGGSDNVSDTPNQGVENYGAPAFPHIDCCSSTATGDPVNGVMFMNYMDYVNDNAMNLFTAGQSTIMNNVVNNVRSTIKNSNGCLVPSGIEDVNSFMLDVTVFPNPSQGTLTVSGQLYKYSDVTVTVSNALGELVYVKEIKNALDIYLSVDLSANSNGIYNLSIKSNDALTNRKVIVSR